MDTMTDSRTPFDPAQDDELEGLDSPEDLSVPEEEAAPVDPPQPEQAEESPQQQAPQNAPVTAYSVPQERLGEAAARITAIDSERDALAQKYEDGEIDFRTYDAQSRTLADERAALQLERIKESVYSDMSAQQRQANWDAAVTTFYADTSNAAFSSPSLQAMMATELKAIWERPESAGIDYLSVLNQARDAVQTQLRAALGIEAQKKESATPVKPAAETTPIPTTLGGTPAARQNTTGGEYAHLDAMNPLDLENALQRMSKDQIDRYLAA